ncbi:tellurite resistance TerB family protein [Microvirga pudoricolor]|uniref:tellurite resistance TerB family protein n=1 Tax=Microvirga pudoricolor TaxID=2778729 RepID=UPI0019516166|nr:TerB family tellurite resistance protein [Microvirga pudoricolor]MBM6593701.1 TerB family tellurite resistance protein [Microvirga pudoricolor]
MSLMANLRELFHDALGLAETAPDHEERLTVAALLLLVAHADGRMLKVEERSLPVLLRSYFGVDEDVAARLLDQAADLSAGTDPAISLADRISHDVPAAERPRLLALAYRVAVVDGQVHEFEDDLIWRIGRLLGLDDTAIAAIRTNAIRNLVAGPSRG